MILSFQLFSLTNGVYVKSTLQNMRVACTLFQGVKPKYQGICSQTMLCAAKLRRSSRCRTPQSAKTGHTGHSTSLTLSDFRRVPFLEHLVLMYFSGEKKKKMEEGYNPLCRAWSTASPRAKVYEHRGRHHCWRACWQLSSPLHPESSINLHIYFLRKQKGGSAE